MTDSAIQGLEQQEPVELEQELEKTVKEKVKKTKKEPKEEPKVKEEPKDTSEKPKHQCKWTSCRGNQCKLKTENTFCTKHTELATNYTILHNVDPKITCVTYDVLKIVPRSKEQIESIMESIIPYEVSSIVDVCFPGGLVEKASIDSEDYIEVHSDEAKYYYRGKTKSSPADYSAGTIKIKFDKYCKGRPVVLLKQNYGLVNDPDSGLYYCAQCYTHLARKVSSLPALTCLE
jgi:hypothetical protein